MGCFLGCFGLSSKRKRRKPANRIQPGDKRICSYEPLDSASASLVVKEKPFFNLDSELKDESRKIKEPLSCKIRKKVRFNLNVQTYEPIQKEEEEDSDHFRGSDDEESSKKGTTKERESEGDSTASYPSNYRYRNCIHSYDDEEEEEYEIAESDLDDYDYYDDDFEDDLEEEDDDNEKLKSVSVNRDSLTTQNARERSEYAHSVLKPVENLSQWKAVKANAKPQRKENVALESRPVLKEISVDTSLSNWLGCESKNSIIQVENKASFPWRRNREDMPILDFTSTI